MPDISSEVQKEVNRIKKMIAETKALLPKANVSFYFYELIITESEKAIREQDVVALVRLLPELKSMQ